MAYPSFSLNPSRVIGYGSRGETLACYFWTDMVVWLCRGGEVAGGGAAKDEKMWWEIFD